MFDQNRTGIFSMLDEECNFKGGNTERFTTNAWQQWGSNKSPYFVQPKSTIPNQFGVNHYASFVNYNTDEWLEKNTDALKEDMYEGLLTSDVEFIRSLLSSDKGMARRKQTVAIRFQNQLKDLRTELESTETQFIRCIKPNMEASPDKLDNNLVGAQLESAGVLQTIALKRQGYPVRRPLAQFCHYFYFIMPSSTVRYFKAEKYSEACTDFLNYYQKLYRWGTPNFAVGKTKVFLRAEVWSALERLALRRKAQLIARCKPFLRRWAEEYRERKRKELEAKLAEQKRLRELREAKMAECANGLPEEKLAWAEDLSNVFPNMERNTLLDIVAEADSQDEALAGCLSVQDQSIDNQSPTTFFQFMRDAGVDRGVTQDLVSNDVKTLAALSKLSADELKQSGCTDLNVVDIKKRLQNLQSQRAKYERLEGAIGSKNQDSVVEDLKAYEANRHQVDFDTKAQQLVAMGFKEEDARLVLAHYNGNVERSAARLLYNFNKQSVKKNASKHGNFNTTDPNVQKLISMGVPKLKAKEALRKTDGDVDAAVKVLF
ncbi:Myosin head (motor domain)/UBA/TS-N domain containing protein, putative [Angomonas deanei]|uniref:Myosin head (Motor domain)/UBA/TS-N domain containing protein, putative n=1 Tax=Angomonas deanei TaxID=59799 RepID=A0A7G2CB24_9TRYP|nr:Myosin head (motor domain)/UBA/TS-N domain containing protein, putative [Angomonas deanei]